MVEVVTVRYETFTANVYLPALYKWRIVPLRKLFKLLRKGIDQYSYLENMEAQEGIQKTLDALSSDAKENWRYASEAFQREYIDPDYHFRRNSKLWREAKKNNNRLLADAKRTKREYEHAEKLKRCFNEIVN